MSGPVLAAIDLAHPETHAMILSEAQAAAGRREAPLAVVTVIPDFGMSIVGAYFEDGAEAKALKDAARLLHGAVSEVLGAEADRAIRHVVRHGTVYGQVLEAAQELGADLIVMGAHRPAFGDYLLGPNAARVVRHAACSVLVLRS